MTATSSRRRWRSKGSLVTIGTVAALLAGLGLTALGLGAADQAVASYDAASWVWSKTKGEVARINGVTAKVDTRVDVPRAQGHQIQVSQSDRFVILRDVDTGAISTMDLTSLQVAQTQPGPSGLGVRVALQDNAAFVIDTVQGEVSQLDPATLAPIGQVLRFPPGITGGVFDGKGRLWVAVPSEGTVTAITPAPLTSHSASAAAGPVRARTVPVAAQSHDLAISTMDNGVAVLDRTTDTLTTVGDDQQVSTPLPLGGPGAVPPRTDGLSVPVTVPDSRHVFVVSRGAMREQFQVPGDGGQLQPAVAWQGFFYVADDATGVVHVFDSAGGEQKSIAFDRPGGPLELEVRENYLFINAPGSPTARVVDDNHGVRVVNKYANDVLGGDKAPAPPTPPPPKPAKPVVGKPGPPRNVRAAAGNAEARVTWQAANPNGAAIMRYVVVGAGRTFQVGANQRSLDVTGLTNGQRYSFQVHAVNAKGDGPARGSNVVVPTAAVPDAPDSATATAKPDGTVEVSWPAANGEGLKITQYQVTAVSDGSAAPVGQASGTSLTVAAGALTYGTSYAFQVVAINERGAGSKTSPVSTSVVPFTRPDKPGSVDAATVASQAGAIQVTWEAPAANGRPISQYVISGGAQPVTVTDGSNAATLTGLGTDKTVTVQVRAVNEAGQSDPAVATARTEAPPAITITGSSATATTATVSFSVDAGGGTATCSMTASNGGGGASGSCGRLTSKSLKPGTAYTFTVTARNAAGTTTKTRAQTTSVLYGTTRCINGKNGATAHYCNADVPGRNGDEIFNVPAQINAKQAGWEPSGTRLETHCKISGDDVDSYIYNNHKHSTWWIQISYKGGKPYIPWAWLNLDNADNLNQLPAC